MRALRGFEPERGGLVPTTLSVLAAVTVVPSSAAAYVCTRTPGLGPSVAWSDRNVAVHRAGRGAEVDERAIDDALALALDAWSGVPCSDLVLSAGTPTEQRLVGFDWHDGSGSPDNQNILVFRNDRATDPLDAWVHTLGAIAITTVTFDTTTGRLVDADIEMNDTAFDFTACDPEDPACLVGFDVANTLTHEIGHVVGLDHPPSNAPGATEATMFASAPRGDTAKRTLATDDELGLCALYPADDPVPGECYGVGRPQATVRFEATGCGAADTGTAMPGAWLLAGVLWKAWRRRR